MMKKKCFSLFEYSEKISNKIGEYIYNKTCDVKDPEHLYAYQYFIFSIVSGFMWMFSGLVLSLLLNCAPHYAIFCISWGISRSTCGGMHLNQHNHCFYSTVFLTVLFSWIAANIANFHILLLTLGFSSIIYKSWCIPKSVETTAEYSVEEILVFRRRFCRNTAIFFIIDITLLYIGYKYDIDLITQFGNCISISMLLCALMLDKSFEWILRVVWKEK